MTTYLSGIDEAGYGPLLGPLVVGLATLSHEDPIRPAAPWKLLAPTVVRRKAARGLCVADSKALHKPSSGDLSPLERGVLSFVACERGGEPVGSFRELVAHLNGGRTAYLEEYPWYSEADLPLPHSASRLELLGSIRKLARRLEGSGLSVNEIRATPVDVREFNRTLQDVDSKGDLNASVIGRFLRWMWTLPERKRMEVWTDRLGGRQRYGPLLYPLFPNARFDILEQGDENQAYQVVDERVSERTMTIHFNKGCEDISFTTALASMTAKYVRELHMVLFNRWWEKHCPGLKPTAGYYADGNRFLQDIDGALKKLKMGRDGLVRRR